MDCDYVDYPDNHDAASSHEATAYSEDAAMELDDSYGAQNSVNQYEPLYELPDYDTGYVRMRPLESQSFPLRENPWFTKASLLLARKSHDSDIGHT